MEKSTAARGWTDKETELVIRGYALGHRPATLAPIVNRSVNAVSRHVYALQKKGLVVPKGRALLPPKPPASKKLPLGERAFARAMIQAGYVRTNK